jgi:hypothetical protein
MRPIKTIIVAIACACPTYATAFSNSAADSYGNSLAVVQLHDLLISRTLPDTRLPAQPSQPHSSFTPPPARAPTYPAWLKPALLLVAAFLFIRLLFRRRKAINPAPQGFQGGVHPSPGQFGTGILVVPATADGNEVRQILLNWKQTHPNDASVVVARYDMVGNVYGEIYAISNQASLWTGEIGRVDAEAIPKAAFGTALFQQQIDGPVRKLVATYIRNSGVTG